MVDRIVVALVETRVVERATAELIAAEVPARILEQVLEGQVVDEVVTRLLADESLERTVETLLTRWFEGPLAPRGGEPRAGQRGAGRLVDEIAHSPEVLEAITAGSASIAGEMANQVRRRTIVADDVAECVARRVLRRSQRKESAALPPGNDGALPPP